MVRTRVGYAGGAKDRPTYHDLGDHTETTEIDFDPSIVSYEELLNRYFSSAGCGATPSRQYAHIIFYHDDEQKRLAESHKGAAGVEIVPHVKFWPAEDYHQKYTLRNSALMAEFSGLSGADFMNSTAAMRVNAYLAGYVKHADVGGLLKASELKPSAAERVIAKLPKR